MRRQWIGMLLAVLGGPAVGAPADCPPASPPAAAAPDEAAFQARLDDIDRRAAKIEDLSARFEQKKFTALLKKPLASSGRVRLKGSAVRWDTEVPEPAVLHSDGRAIRMYYPRQHVVEVYPIDKRITDLAASPLPRLAALREHFRIEMASRRDLADSDAEVAPGYPRCVALRLTPTDGFLKEHVERVLVLLNADAAHVVQVEVDDADGDRTVIRFDDVKLNTGLKDGDVALALPPGTRESRPLEGVGGDPGQASQTGQGPRGRTP